jgi:shikimate kinase
MTKEGLILTGFMGMGKSTVGPAVAKRLDLAYFDTDDWLETVSGRDVPHLVKTNMPEFRRLEAQVLETILDQEPGVIATGGGIVSTAFGRAALLAAKVPVVWLKAPFEVAASRVGSDSGRERPLFSNVETARVLFDERQKWYEETAAYEIDAARPAEEVVEAVVLSVS